MHAKEALYIYKAYVNVFREQDLIMETNGRESVFIEKREPDVISVTLPLIGGIEARRQNRVVDCLFVVSIPSVLNGRLESY